MAKNDSKPITVKISSASNALEEINSAIDKALKTEDSNLNKQFEAELKLQGKLGNLEDQLNLSGMNLNGPMVGLSIPTISQLYAPLRKILDESNPCDANPFIGDVAPSETDNPAILSTQLTANSGIAGQKTIFFKALNSTSSPTAPAIVVAGIPIFGPGISAGTYIVSTDYASDSLQLSKPLSVDVSTASGAYKVTNVADITFDGTGGGSNDIVAINGAMPAFAVGMVISGPGLDDGTTIKSIDTTAKTIQLQKNLTGPVSGDHDAYVAINTVSFKPTGGASGQSVITVSSTTDLVLGMTVAGTGIPSGSTIVAIKTDASVTIDGTLTVKAQGTITASQSLPFSAFPSQGSIIETNDATNLMVGQWVVGTGVPDGTTIVSLKTATAAAGAITTTITLSKVMTAPAAGNKYTAVSPDVINFWIQSLYFTVLDSDLTNLLASYKNSPDASLEEETVYFIQKSVSDLIERDITYPKLQSAAKALSSSENITSIQIGLVQDVFDAKKNPSTESKVDEVESKYYDSLNGFDSTVFPPPGGRDFLTNLENQIMVSVKTSVNDMLHPKGKRKKPKPSEVLALNSVIDEQAVIRSGVHDALFNKIAELGIQGTLLADAVDNETSAGIKQNITSLLSSMDDFKANLTTLNATAGVEAQSVLAAQAAVENFLGLWDIANDALQANSSSLGQGDKSFNSLNGTFNGAGKGNRSYLSVLVDPGSAGSLSVMSDIESRSTQITAELAGLLYLANSILIKQAPLNQANGLDATITAQFNTDINNLQAAIKDYSQKLAAYLSGYQDYKEAEDTVFAGSTVIGSVTNMLGAAPSTNPQF